MEKDWVKIFATNQTFRAEIVKGMLQENDINAVLVNRLDSSYLGTLPGMAEVYVHQLQEAEAIRLLQENPANEE
jgi:hypothetical protein